MASLPSPFHGLEWSSTLFGPMAKARWTMEPDLGAIRQTIQSLRPSSAVEVTFLCEGGYNKVYDVKLDSEDLIMRIALPVDPYNKTLSEVATMNWIRRTTNIPIPVPLAYDVSNNNTIGFAWILMTKMPGERLGDFWESLSLSQMIKLTQKLAQHFASLFQNPLRGIGSITERRIGAEGLGSAEILQIPCPLVATKKSIPNENSGAEDITSATEKPSLYHKGCMSLATTLVSPTISTVPIQVLRDANNNAKVTTEGAAIGLSGTPDHISKANAMLDVGQIVSPVFFWGSNIQRNVYRGPFHSSHDWLKARLELNEHSCLSTLANASKSNLPEFDKFQIALATEGLVLTKKLKSLLPHVFPPPQQESNLEPSVLIHEDLSTWNMLLSDDGELSAILDWEMIVTLPLWKACDYPYFLQGPPRHDEPNIADYTRGEDGEIDNILYWQDMWEHRRTLLRSAYLYEMEQLAPEWVEIHARSEVQRDFDIAMSKCAIGHYGGFINEWIEGFTGEGFSLGLKEMRDALGMESY